MIIIKDKKEAYILLETIISVLILSIISISLLKSNMNEKNLYQLAYEKFHFLNYVTIALNHRSNALNDKNINLYDLVKYHYKIKNDMIIKRLKNTKLLYKVTEKSTINLPNQNQKIYFLINDIVLGNKQATSHFLSIKQ